MEGRDEAGIATQMVGYTGMFKQDPVFDTERQAELTSIWSDHLIDRPENHLTGVSFARGGYHRIGKRVTNGAGGYTIHRADHWIFDGTDIDYGDVLGGGARIVGYECDGCDFTYIDGLRHRPGRPLHPHDCGTPTGAQRTVRTRVHRVTRVRRTWPRAPPRTRSRGPRHLHLGRRRHGDHIGVHRLGSRSGRP